MRYFVMGDVHGCCEELINLLDSLNINKSEDTVIFVGDYFDRGPKSYEVWCTLKELKKDMGERCVLLRGNHEVMLVDYLNKVDSTWTYNGYKATIQSFFIKNDISLDEVADWIKKETVYYYSCNLFDVVHAGRDLDDLSKEDKDTLIWDRSLFSGRDWEGKFTFIGHTSLRENPAILTKELKELLDYEKEYDIPNSGVIDIDTGCVYGNKLSAAEVTEDGKFKLHFVPSSVEKRN